MRITYADEVFEELVNLSAYIAEYNEPAAQKFLDACDDAFQLLLRNPRIGTPNKFTTPELADIRMWQVKRFENYLIFYLPTKEGIRILHVINSAVDYDRVFAQKGALG